jgi:hypothetical protein
LTNNGKCGAALFKELAPPDDPKARACGATTQTTLASMLPMLMFKPSSQSDLPKKKKTNATRTMNVTTVASPATLRVNAASAPMEIGEAGRVSTLPEPELQTQEKEAPPEHPTKEDTAVIASLYHDPEYHF